jgi:hypothetical protein
MIHLNGTLRRMCAIALAATLAGFMIVLPVAAAPIARGEQSGTDSYTEELCDEDWSVESSFTLSFKLKAGRHGNPTPLFFSHDSYVNIYTDPADATRGFVISGHSLFKDQRATLVSGTIYLLDTVQVGQPMVISSLDGRVVARDRGRLAFIFLVDTHGSSDLDDVEVLDFDPTTASGPHPIADAMCEFVAEALED